MIQVIGAEARLKRTKALKRSKRDWVLPPTKLWENTDYTKKEFIAKVGLLPAADSQQSRTFNESLKQSGGVPVCPADDSAFSICQRWLLCREFGPELQVSTDFRTCGF